MTLNKSDFALNSLSSTKSVEERGSYAKYALFNNVEERGL